MMYKVSSVYAPSHDAGIQWSSMGIAWLDMNPVVSERDSDFSLFSTFDNRLFPYR